MRKGTVLAGLIFVLAIAWCLNAYASATDGNNTFFPDMFNSLGSFIYNLLPWNWGKWAGPNNY